MLIALIGTSGSGKSYWAKRLAAERGYQRFCCDDLIEERLSSELSARGLSGITGVAAWMGNPSEPDFERKQKLYLECERTVMQEILAVLETRETKDTIVIDTTGSVIYTGDDICQPLMRLARVVYLEADRASLDHMAAQFLKNPKPIIWGPLLGKAVQQTTREGLAACYKELIENRAQHYRRFAHVVVPFMEHKTKNLPIERFLELVNSK